MCELFAVKADDPIPIEWILQYARLLEEYGYAGFSWGIAWKNETGIKRYRAVEGIRRDTLAPLTLRGTKAKEYLVHLRRPSLMKSISFTNAQPYLTEDESLAFAHNGYFLNHMQYRSLFVNNLEGTSDSEVGYNYYLMKQKDNQNPLLSLEQTYKIMKGKANLMVLKKDEPTYLYAGNDQNLMYLFELDGIKCCSTSLHSHDDFIFQTIFPSAASIRQIPLFSGCVLTSGNFERESSYSTDRS
jgi:predicted glutamine amidotransferase